MRETFRDALEFLFRTAGGVFLLFVIVVVIFLALFWPQAEANPAPWLGIVGRDLDAQTVQDYSLPFNRGVLLEKVFPDSPAYFSNLAPGDVVIKLGNRTVYSQNQLRTLIADTDPEENIWLTVFRNGAFYNVMLELGRKPMDRSLPAQAIAAVQPTNVAPPPISPNSSQGHPFRGVCTNCHVITNASQGSAPLAGAQAAFPPTGAQSAWQQLPGANPIKPLTEFTWSGIALETLSPGGAVGIGLPANTTGVVVDEVVVGSLGARGGVLAGDLVREINGFAVYDAQSFANIVQSQQLTGGVLLVNRSGRNTYVTVPEN
jgi:S1-C subfamily serine protease